MTTGLLHLPSGVDGYDQLVDYVLKHGRDRTPRGQRTLDAGHLTVVLEDVTRSLPIGIGRNLSPRIGAAEALQLIGGFSEPRLMFAASERFRQYAEEDGRFHGAYGNRIGQQVACALAKLRNDRDSRQAVVTLWDPWLDNLPGKRDYPCTVTLGLALVDDKLDLNVTMRSQDIWRGAVYDWFQFTQLQQTCASCLDVSPGVYRHTTWSTHIYAADIENITDLHTPTLPHAYQPHGLGRPGESFVTIQRRARTLISNILTVPTTSERWYLDQLTPLMGRLLSEDA